MKKSGTVDVFENEVLAGKCWQEEPITPRFAVSGSTYTGAYTYDGHGARVLELRGRFLEADITVNGAHLGTESGTTCDVTDLLEIGKNDIAISLQAPDGGVCDDGCALDAIVMQCEDQLIRVKKEHYINI